MNVRFKKYVRTELRTQNADQDQSGWAGRGETGQDFGDSLGTCSNFISLPLSLTLTDYFQQQERDRPDTEEKLCVCPYSFVFLSFQPTKYLHLYIARKREREKIEKHPLPS